MRGEIFETFVAHRRPQWMIDDESLFAPSGAQNGPVRIIAVAPGTRAPDRPQPVSRWIPPAPLPRPKKKSAGAVAREPKKKPAAAVRVVLARESRPARQRELKERHACRTCPRTLNKASIGDQCWHCRHRVGKVHCKFCSGLVRASAKHGTCSHCYMRVRFAMGWAKRSKARKTCTVSGCGRRVRRYGLCDAHDRHMTRYGAIRPVKEFRDPAGRVPYRRTAA